MIEHKYLVIRDPIKVASKEIKGPYSNFTLAENDLKIFRKMGGHSMILKTVDGVIQEDENTIELVNGKKISRDYENMDVALALIQSVKNKCK